MELFKDNPSDYYHAFCQMVYALNCLKAGSEFMTDTYAFDAVEPWEDAIKAILEKRQTDACADWKALAESISGCDVEDFDIDKYQKEYMEAAKDDKDDSFIGRYILAALEQKSMVTNRIYASGNLLAGVSVDFSKKGFRGIKDFRRLAREYERRQQDV